MDLNTERGVWAATMAVTTAIGVLGGVLVGKATTETVESQAAESSVVLPTLPQERPAQPVLDGGFPGNGTFEVGVDVKPGKYKTGGKSPDSYMGCTWSRLSNLSGSDNVIALNYGEGPATVVIKKSDAGFKSQNCQPWRPAS